MKFNFYKKGALELSMNAIIIIILAITMLGLGLGFMKTFMGKSQDTMKNIFDDAELKNPATAQEKMTIPREIEIKADGKAHTVVIGFYCDSSATCINVKPKFKGGKPSTACIRADTGAAYASADDAKLVITAIPETLDYHGDLGFTTKITADSDVTGSWLCSMCVDGEDGGGNAVFCDGTNSWAQTRQVTLMLQ